MARELRDQQVHVEMNLARLVPRVDRPDRAYVQPGKGILECCFRRIAHDRFRRGQ
jgi:hypothetical protein